MSAIDVMVDWSNKKLLEVPKEIMNMASLKMLYLEGNYISSLPEDFFVKLPKLIWFDMRNNKLKSIPRSIAYHNCLETLLVQGNDIDVLPVELCKYISEFRLNRLLFWSEFDHPFQFLFTLF